MSSDTERFVGTVFLDRDGTINRKAPDNEYVKTLDEFALLPTVAEAIRALNDAGRRVIVVTNQRGIALGQMTEYDLHVIHEHMLELLAACGARVDAVYHCPHDRGSCVCRKPEPGLFIRAADDHADIRFHESAIFGDSDSDMAAGMKLGMVRVLVGNVLVPEHSIGVAFDHRAPTLLEGVHWLLAQQTPARPAMETSLSGSA